MHTLARRPVVSRQRSLPQRIKHASSAKQIVKPRLQSFRVSKRAYTPQEYVGTGVAQKTTTGIPGLDVVPRAREILIKLCERYLDDIQALPAGTFYRDYMSKFVQVRLDICHSTEDIFEIEDKIGVGQIEELINDLEKEHSLLPFLLEHKPWETNGKWDTKFYLYSDVR